jgi:hypothetical protein
VGDVTNRKGPRFERLVADYLQAEGFLAADRRIKHGAKDKGDITGIPDWTLELKDTEPMNFSALLNQAIIEAANAGTTFFAGIQKRRNKNVRDAYVVLPLWLFARVLKRLLGMDPPVCRDCGRAA